MKIITGIAAAYFFISYRGGSDMDWYMYETNFLFDAVKTNPALFYKFILGIEDAEAMQQTAIITSWNATDFYYNDARTLLRVNLILRIFSFGYTNVHVIFFCFLSVTGFAGLIRFFKKFIPGNDFLLLAAVIFIPSVFAWTSMLLKETLLIFFLGVFLFSASQINSLKNKTNILVAIVSFIFLFTIKPFVILLLLPALIAFYVSHGAGWKKILFLYVLSYTCTFLLVTVAGNISGNKTLPEIIAVKQQSSMKFSIFRGAKNYFQPPVIAASWASIIRHSPQAVANIFTVPSVTGKFSKGMKMFSVENYFLVILIICSLAFAIKNKTKPDVNILFFCFSFALTYFILTGLTTADAGALIRYKLPGLIFLFAGCVAVLKQKEEIS